MRLIDASGTAGVDHVRGRRLPLLAAVALLPACGILSDVQQQSAVVESVGEIRGTVRIATSQAGPVYVRIYQPGGTANEFVLQHELLINPDGSFRQHVLPGTYFVGAYLDVNGNGRPEPEQEPANYYGSEAVAPLPVVVTNQGSAELPTLTLTGLLVLDPAVRLSDGEWPISRNVGAITRLDDPRFSDDNASLGLWRPVDFLKTVGGGLFLLQDYRPDLTPVLFVHGISGSPANWAPVIAHLDGSRFQPWFVYYPSGVSLDVVTDFLDRAIDELQARYGFRSLHVVAHSMGGLVARSFVMQHARAGHAAAVTLFMTINSPMLGMSSAANGVDLSPVVIPSWRDVARGSEFIDRLYAEPWPAAVPYHLVFSYLPGEDGDGVVNLASQIPVRLQDEGARLYGFKATHAGVLGKPDFLRRFEQILADASVPTAAP